MVAGYYLSALTFLPILPEALRYFLQLFSQAMQEENGSFASTEISLN